jgi:shikimate dehydrogenase
MQNRVGVIGWPIEHSLSPAMHNAAFAALGMGDWLYDKMAIPPDVLRHSLRELRDHGYIGINVTVPHKQAVMPFVRADGIAQAVGAVNTIDFRTNIGTNTDVQGFMDDLTAHNVDVSGRKVLVIGAGGAARAAVYGLANAGALVRVINRTRENADAMINSLGVPALTAASFSEASAWIAEASALPALIINCTTVGMMPNADASPWPEEVPFPRGVIVYDMIYRPGVTRLMTLAEAGGGQAIGGLGMLVRQGAAAFQRWTGVQPPIDVMRAAAEAELQKSR